jgi:MFS family permease
VNCFAFTVGALIYIESFPVLVFMRLCQGFCVGFFSAIAPLIIKELSPTEISGTLGSYAQLNICLGVFIGCIFTYILKKITGDDTGRDFWFIVFGFTEITLAIQTLILIFVFPYETPRYLLSIGK